MEDKKPDYYYDGDRKEMLAYVPLGAKVILEVGCGIGNFASVLKHRNQAEVWGIEIDETSTRKAAQVLDHVITGDISTLLSQLPNTYFDAIIFNDVLEHLVDPYSLIEQLKTKLTNQGVIVSSIPNIRYFRALIEIIWHKQFKYTDIGIFDRTHMRFFTKKSIIEMYENAGYEVLTIKGIRKSKSIRPFLLNLLFLGKLSDSKYMQFATVAAPIRS